MDIKPFAADKREIEAIVVDLDGTLLNDDHKLSERNQKALKKAAENGVRIILATGKTRKAAESVMKSLDLQTPGVFVQGTIIANADGTTRQQYTIEASAARRVIQYAESAGFAVILYSGNRLLVQSPDERINQITAYHEPQPEGVGPLVNKLFDTPVHKLLILGDTEKRLKALRWQLEQQIGDKVSFTTSSVLTTLEILPKGASKGNAVKTLLRDIVIDPNKVMAVGDAPNDIEMLQIVGLGVAVENAAESVKSAADAVVASNNNHGVAEAIERFVLGEMLEKPEEVPVEVAKEIQEPEAIEPEIPAGKPTEEQEL